MIRNKKALLIAVLGAAAITAPTLSVAQQPQERGGYLGISGGRADYKNACEGLTIPCDESDTAWRFFGGYQFSRNLALEFGYADLGAAGASGVLGPTPAQARVEVKAWDLSGVLAFPVTPQFAFFGKLGVYHADTEGSANVGGLAVSTSDKNSGITYGIGAQYDLMRNLGLRVEFQQYANVGSSETGEDDISLFSVGAVFRF
jgi:OmpA-OmpF porin, OOP family